MTTKSNKIIYIEVIIAFIFFTLTLFFSREQYHMSFSTTIGMILYFMIFIELTRALIDYIFSEEHKFKVRYIYDMGIMFIIREILVTITSKHSVIEKEIIFLSILSFFLILLFLLRIFDAKVFNYLDNCSSCEYTFKKHK